MDKRSWLLVVGALTAIVLGGLAFFALQGKLFTTSMPFNPLLGQWRSQEKVFMDHELWHFTETGIIENGRIFSANYRIDGKVVYVQRAGETLTFRIISPDIIEQQVPRVGQIRYDRVNETSQ